MAYEPTRTVDYLADPRIPRVPEATAMSICAILKINSILHYNYYTHCIRNDIHIHLFHIYYYYDITGIRYAGMTYFL